MLLLGEKQRWLLELLQLETGISFGLLHLSFLISFAHLNLFSVLIKGLLYISPWQLHPMTVFLHFTCFSLYPNYSEFTCICLVLISKQWGEDLADSFLLETLQVLIYTGAFSLDLTLLLPFFLLSLFKLVHTARQQSTEEVSDYKNRILEENRLFAHELEAMMANPNIKKSHIRRSSTILAKLRKLQNSSQARSFTENSENDSPSSEISRSRKSSFNVEDQPETPKSGESSVEQILPGISNEEVKEIINTLISQEYLVLNPKKCSDNEIDVIAVALEAKNVLTQSIENLPGSSHRILKVNKRIKKRAQSIRSMIEVSEPLCEVLECIGEWDFDCFELIQITKDPAFEVGLYIFNTLSLSESFNIDNMTLRKFLSAVEHGYNRGNFYHNSIHAADVTASTLFLIQKGLSRCGNLVDLDVFALVVAALCHDLGHLGVNNSFLVATSNELAIKYNDQSCLESMHANKAFTIINTDGCRITKHLNKADYQRFRKSVISAILSTDLQVHFSKLHEFKANLEKNFDISDDKFRALAIQMCLKCADIGHGARKLDIHINWTRLITKEFFKQGEKEKEFGIPITPLCDRDHCVVSKSQVGFLEVLVRPLFKAWEEFIELHNEGEDELEVRVCMQNINENIEYWKLETDNYMNGKPEFELGDDGPLLG